MDYIHNVLCIVNVLVYYERIAAFNFFFYIKIV